MQLQAVADTAAQFTLVSEEFNKSLEPAPPIRKEVAINTAGKGMQMDGYIAKEFLFLSSWVLPPLLSVVPFL
jgi:hypothetical protein